MQNWLDYYNRLSVILMYTTHTKDKSVVDKRFLRI